MTAAIIAAIRPFLPFFFFPSSTNCICGPACTFSAVCSPHSQFSSPQLQFSPQLQAVSPSAGLPDSHSTVAPPHLGQKASLSCKIRLQFSHFFIVFLPIFSEIRIQCRNFSRMCRLRNIILQQKIPHVKTFFPSAAFLPVFCAHSPRHGFCLYCSHKCANKNRQFLPPRKKLPTIFRQNAADIACCI